ncbi:MAG: hypothetical protein ACE5KZ_06960 [Candidatus Scalinduaceae bacterium]
MGSNVMIGNIENEMSVTGTSKGIERRVHKRLELSLPITLLDRIIEPQNSNSEYSLSAQKAKDNKTILGFLEMMKPIFTTVIGKLKNICLKVRDWYEDRPFYNETVDTHNYDTRILLINRLRNH